MSDRRATDAPNANGVQIRKTATVFKKWLIFFFDAGTVTSSTRGESVSKHCAPSPLLSKVRPWERLRSLQAMVELEEALMLLGGRAPNPHRGRGAEAVLSRTPRCVPHVRACVHACVSPTPPAVVAELGLRFVFVAFFYFFPSALGMTASQGGMTRALDAFYAFSERKAAAPNWQRN